MCRKIRDIEWFVLKRIDYCIIYLIMQANTDVYYFNPNCQTSLLFDINPNYQSKSEYKTSLLYNDSIISIVQIDGIHDEDEYDVDDLDDRYNYYYD